MKYLYLIIYIMLLMPSPASAQRPQLGKLSPMLRQLVRQERHQLSVSPSKGDTGGASTSNRQEVCAFLRITDDGEQVFRRYDCRQLAQVGNIFIALIPINSLPGLSLDKRVKRIEASRSNHLLMDSVTIQLGATPVHQGRELPQAYTGKGVVVGVMDIGFDLTHPNFYSRDTTEYRIRALWDMLSIDTVGSPFPVGRDYVGRKALLALGHCRDGLEQTHGTHTLGIAAGSGFNTNYIGMAPESDICIVANAVSEDINLIDSADIYKYTFATDALGFKYIFDYARSIGQPCVVSFSEGSGQDFWGYDQLYYEMLDSLVGPGRILVAAAGNKGRHKTWFRKPAGEESTGTFLRSGTGDMMFTLKSSSPFSLRFIGYTDQGDTLNVRTEQVLEEEDSVYTEMLRMADHTLIVKVEAYPSCYIPEETCYDVTVTTDGSVGAKPRLSVEVVGSEADVEAYLVTGTFTTYDANPLLCAGECTHNIHSPSSAPSVICVGGTIYRQGVYNYLGKWKSAEKGSDGQRGTYSSVGPTMDGRIKPDVMAPGANIISSYSSYYLENNPLADDITWDVAHFPFNGRTYAWNSNSGTSMSCPAVAGAIALWLQAKPDLTPEEVLDVFNHTCRRYDDTLPYPNNEYGYGEVDAYHGLLYLLSFSGINDISTHHTPAHISLRDNALHLDFGTPATAPVRLRLFDTQGMQRWAMTIPAGSGSHTLTLPRLCHGVYALQIDGPSEIGGSTLIRL